MTCLGQLSLEFFFLGICKNILTPSPGGVIIKHRQDDSRHNQDRQIMKLRMNIPVGSTPITIEAENVKELFEATELLGQLPQSCGGCNGTSIRPAYSKTGDGFEFYYLKCNSCGHEFRLGQRKSDQGLFPNFSPEGAHKNGWKPPFKASGNRADESAINDDGDYD